MFGNQDQKNQNVPRANLKKQVIGSNQDSVLGCLIQEKVF